MQDNIALCKYREGYEKNLIFGGLFQNYYVCTVIGVPASFGVFDPEVLKNRLRIKSLWELIYSGSNNNLQVQALMDNMYPLLDIWCCNMVIVSYSALYLQRMNVE